MTKWGVPSQIKDLLRDTDTIYAARKQKVKDEGLYFELSCMTGSGGPLHRTTHNLVIILIKFEISPVLYLMKCV